MSFSAATSFAQTILSYFSPTKSPYYSVIAFGVTASIFSADITTNWLIIYIPITLLLLYSTLLSLFDRPDFDEKEYNDQIKFARAFSLSAAILCLVYTGLTVLPDTETNENHWYFWAAYVACLVQLVLFCFYTFVYANLQTRPVNQNFVQLALITSTFLIGLTYTNNAYASAIEYDDVEMMDHYLVIFLCLYVFWLLTAFVWFNHLRKTIVFKVLIPQDASRKNS
jgi:uncharacterized membrane protein YjfL (UPF0719 family)